jgi:hypothetical protein
LPGILAGTMHLNHGLHEFHSGGLATRPQGKWFSEE